MRGNGGVDLIRPVGASVQSNAGSRGVRISGSNAGYSMFGGSVKSTGYPLRSTVSHFTSPPLRQRVPSHFTWSLLYVVYSSPSHAVCDKSACKMAALSVEVILLAAASATRSSNTSCPLSPSVLAVGCNQPSVLKILENVPKKCIKY